MIEEEPRGLEVEHGGLCRKQAKGEFHLAQAAEAEVVHLLTEAQLMAEQAGAAAITVLVPNRRLMAKN